MNYATLPTTLEGIRSIIRTTSHYEERIIERHGCMKQAIHEVTHLIFKGKVRKWKRVYCVHGILYRHILEQVGDSIILITIYEDDNNRAMLEGIGSMFNFLFSFPPQNLLQLLLKYILGEKLLRKKKKIEYSSSIEVIEV